jgi:hypothetical protein
VEAGNHHSTARLREMQEQMHRHGGAMDGAMDGSRLLDLLRDDVVRLRHQVSSVHQPVVCCKSGLQPQWGR